MMDRNKKTNKNEPVVRKPLKKAAAVKYETGDNAPTVIAKGKGLIADNILEKAQESNVPVYEDPELADTLTKLDIGDYIPPELYKVVAEIMIFVSDLDKMRDKIR